MFLEHTGDLDGVRVEGSGGKRFPHVRKRLGGDEVGLVPYIRLHVESDKRKGIWCPRGSAAEVKFDSGGDSTYLHSALLDNLGVKDDSKIISWPEDASGKPIKSKKKLVWIRVVHFEDYPFPVWINYSTGFREKLFNISLGALAPYFRIVLIPEFTILYRPGLDLEAGAMTRA